MGEKLDNVVDNYMQMKGEIIFHNVPEEERALFINSTKKQLKKEIQEEIEAEVKTRALKKAQDEIERKAGLRRIAEFRKLALDGVVVAVFVGLFVNQATEIIGYLKGTAPVNGIQWTVVLAVVFLLICIGIFGWRFLTEFIKLLKKEQNDETD